MYMLVSSNNNIYKLDSYNFVSFVTGTALLVGHFLTLIWVPKVTLVMVWNTGEAFTKA